MLKKTHITYKSGKTICSENSICLFLINFIIKVCKKISCLKKYNIPYITAVFLFILAT